MRKKEREWKGDGVIKRVRGTVTRVKGPAPGTGVVLLLVYFFLLMASSNLRRDDGITQ